jgi:hypothetical protein
MILSSELAEFRSASKQAMRHRFVATKETTDTSGEPDDFGHYPTTTETVYDGPARITSNEVQVKLRTEDLDWDAPGLVTLTDFPVVDTEKLSCTATFAGVKRPCRVVAVDRSDVAVRLAIEFTGRGEKA